MAEQRRYRGPAWPFPRHTAAKADYNNRDPLWPCFWATRAAQGDLRDAFDKAAAAIDNDNDLSDQGKAKARRELVTQYRESGAWRSKMEFVEESEKRTAALLAELTAPTKPPNDESPFDQVMRAHRVDRTVRRYEALPPDGQRAAFRAAIQTGDAELLRSLLAEPALLSEGDARRATVVLMEQADKQKFAVYSELAGKMNFNGEHDPSTSALAVAKYSFELLNQHMDEWSGTDQATEAIRAKLQQQLKVAGPALVLTEEEARSPQAYRTARDFAVQHNRVLSIEGPQGEGSIDPAPVNGQGGGQ
jgi:hypothetical protein